MASCTTTLTAGQNLPRIEVAMGMQLEPALRRALEGLLGADLGAVRVHEGPVPAMINLLAFACGEDVFFNSGGYDPGTPEGMFVLAHELQHVLQQRQMNLARQAVATLNVLEDATLEAEANHAGLRAAANLKFRGTIDRTSFSGKELDEGWRRNPLALPGVIQPLRVGKIPRAGFLAAHVPAADDYEDLENLPHPVRHNVADFTVAMQTRIRQANITFYSNPLINPLQAMIPNPLPVAGGNWASDENRTQLWRTQGLVGWVLEIDHIVPYEDWGCNDYRNARILSKQQNNPHAFTSRPAANNFRVVCMETVANVRGSGIAVGRNEILNIAKLNPLLNRAKARYDNGNQNYEPDHYGLNPLTHPYEMTASDFEALYYGL